MACSISPNVTVKINVKAICLRKDTLKERCDDIPTKALGELVEKSQRATYIHINEF